VVLASRVVQNKDAGEACRLLGNLGPKAREAEPALSQALTSERVDYQTRVKVADHALQALRKIAPEKYPS